MKRKSWTPRGTLGHVHHRNDRRFAFTIFGAFGDCLEGGPVYLFGKSTNQKDYQKFLRMVHAKVKPQPPGVKAIWFFDGHPSHTTKKSLALAN